MTSRLAPLTAALRGLLRRLHGRLDPGPGPGADPAMLEFLPDLDAIVEEPPPRNLQRTLWVVASFLLAAVILSAIGQVDIVVRGTGRLSTSAPPMVLQPLERSILRDLRVRPGDHVAAGQVLATLDPTFAQADMAQLNARQRSLLAQMQRMESELAGLPFDAGDGSDPERVLQASLYAQRKADYAARVAAFDEDIRRIDASIVSAQTEAEGLRKQLAVVREVVTMRETLLHSQTGSKLSALDAHNVELRTERELNGALNQQGELRHSLAARKAERLSFMETWRRETMEKLATARDDAAKVNEDLIKATRVRSLVELTAPADAVVVEVAKRSLGSVLREAEPVVSLVAADSPLMVETELASADVGYAKVGDPVRVKVDAFPYQRHGMLDGSVLNIGMDSAPPEGAKGAQGVAASIHRAQIALTSTRLENLPDGAALIPGMTVTAEIKVGQRSVLSYFLYPVIRGLGESIREP